MIIRPGQKSNVSQDYYHNTIKSCVDPVVLACVGDEGFINGKSVRGIYTVDARMAGSFSKKVVHTEEHEFCFPACDCPWVSCDMPFCYGGIDFAIHQIKPSRYRGWTCLILRVPCIHKKPKGLGQ